jgi:hypothetical protein
MILVILLILIILISFCSTIEGLTYKEYKLKIDDLKQPPRPAPLKKPKITDPIKPNCECFDSVTKTKILENDLVISQIEKTVNELEKEAKQASTNLSKLNSQLDHMLSM